MDSTAFSIFPMRCYLFSISEDLERILACLAIVSSVGLSVIRRTCHMNDCSRKAPKANSGPPKTTSAELGRSRTSSVPALLTLKLRSRHLPSWHNHVHS